MNVGMLNLLGEQIVDFESLKSVLGNIITHSKRFSSCKVASSKTVDTSILQAPSGYLDTISVIPGDSNYFIIYLLTFSIRPCSRTLSLCCPVQSITRGLGKVWSTTQETLTVLILVLLVVIPSHLGGVYITIVLVADALPSGVETLNGHWRS